MSKQSVVTVTVQAGAVLIVGIITACLPLSSGPPAELTPTLASAESNLSHIATVARRPAPTLKLTAIPTATVEAEHKIVALINQKRAEHGLTVLEVDQRLRAAAQAHSQDMARYDFFAHTSSNGSSPGDRLVNQGYQWHFFAENLGCGHPSAEAVMQAWLDSPEHRANILAPEAEHLGIGVMDAPHTECAYYWASVFAAEQ